MSRIQGQEFTVLADEQSSPNVEYIGIASVGSLNKTDLPIWKIMKVEKIEAISTKVTWADGDIMFDNIWDNRVSLVYS